MRKDYQEVARSDVCMLSSVGQILVDREVTGYTIPAGWMFGHRTRMQDAWVPAVENIYMPRINVNASRCEVRLCPESESASFVKRTRPWKYWFQSGSQPGLDKTSFNGAQIFLDQRHVYLENMAHIIHDLYLDVAICRRALALNGIEADVVCVIPESTSQWVRQALSFLGLDFVSTDKAMRADWVTVDKGLKYGLISEYFRDSLVGCDLSRRTPEKIFIARKKTRAIYENDSLREVLEKHGYETVYFEDCDFETQLLYVVNANRIVAVHGAALGWLCFKATAQLNVKSDWSVIEIFPPGYTLARGFREHVAVLGGKWCGVRGRLTPECVRDTDWKAQPQVRAFDNFHVDHKSVARALDLVENGIDPTNYCRSEDGDPT